MKASRYRFRILALLFVATTINYLDRSIIGVLGPTLQYKIFQWSDVDYANINIAFKVAYAIGMLVMGGIIDKFGSRWGYAISIGIWSLFGMLHAVVRPAFGVIGFVIARFGLGFGEAGNFPAALKTVAEWFPKKDRAFAAGIFNAGSNVGAILAPLLIPLVVAANGENWQYAFLMTGLFSIIWIAIWLSVVKDPAVHPSVSLEELAYINSDVEVNESGEKIPWKKVLPLRQTWAFAIGKLSDAAWWFYLFWSGKFLYDQFGLNINKLALPLVIIYLVADIGSIAGGWLSRFLMSLGWNLNKARKLTMLICTIFILPVILTTQVKTTFDIDNEFLTTISNASYTETQTIQQEGETVTREINIPVPEEVILKISTIQGTSFGNARDFIQSINMLLGMDTGAKLESVLMDHARSNNRYWIAVLLIAIAAGGHQAWSANLLTIPSDIFPKKAVASVVGVGGMVGAIAGLAADFGLGQVLQSSGPSGYFFAFLVAGLMYLIALAGIHLLLPRMIPLDEKLKPVNS